MIDRRIDTFLTLCRTGSYTKAARLLHMTQPAVTQHIRWLEEYFSAKLCTFENRTFTLTKKGEELLAFAATMKSDAEELTAQLRAGGEAEPVLRFGATLTIGEYTLRAPLVRYLEQYPKARLSLRVENTDILLEELRALKLDFAFIEGHFDRSEYDVAQFCKARFIAVCAGDDPRTGRAWTMEALTGEHIILREQGSGTRGIFEQLLWERNMTTDSFAHVTELGNLNLIKALVRERRAVTFLYEDAVVSELADGSLRELSVEGLPVFRDFSFVTLKNSRFTPQYRRFLDFCKDG